jgi:hypothetical protein
MKICRCWISLDRNASHSSCRNRAASSAGRSAGDSREIQSNLIGRFCGPAEAARIARLFLLRDRSEGQPPSSAIVRPWDHGDVVIAGVQA